ncbi:MAG TPA: hypothetical protein PKD64_10490 [Pirellulaceae bacterium]|nr:hypothetical protein [Pirellulaceae bacterium]HMO92608.1 hypothetical protein [Pirellulaceae bacterium]HMP70699.1 hypothetical protein [Pirellulaceae bacterium]
MFASKFLFKYAAHNHVILAAVTAEALDTVMDTAVDATTTADVAMDMVAAADSASVADWVADADVGCLHAFAVCSLAELSADAIMHVIAAATAVATVAATKSR